MTMSKTLSLLAAALCAALFLLTGPDRCPAAETPTAEQKIEQELEKPTQLEFIETPLQDVIDYLKKRHGIEIQIDRKALDDVGLDPSTIPTTKKLKGLSLRSLLELTLRELDLTYLVEDEVLLITTPEDAETRLTTKLYPVGDLVASQDQTVEDRRRKELVEAITSGIDAETWRKVGGPGSITTMSFQAVPTLAVSQTYHVHRKIAAFLEEQRKLVQAAREATVPRCPVVDIEMTPAAEKIAKTLKQPTELSFVETPLQDVVDYLKKKHQIEIQIDRKALGDVGLDASTIPVTKNLKGISLRSGLRLLLRELDLTYVIQDEVLLITTPEEAETRLTTRIYAVGDLLGFFPVDSRYFPVDTGVPVVGTWKAAPGRPQGSEPQAETKADASVASVPQPSAVASRVTTLADMITCIIEPTSWETVGGPGAICSGWVGGVDVLIVSQSRNVHEQIGRLIEKLREFVRCNRSTATPAVAKPTSDKPPKARPPVATSAKEVPGDQDEDPSSR
jgi:hypothetical protein